MTDLLRTFLKENRLGRKKRQPEKELHKRQELNIWWTEKNGQGDGILIATTTSNLKIKKKAVLRSTNNFTSMVSLSKRFQHMFKNLSENCNTLLWRNLLGIFRIKTCKVKLMIHRLLQGVRTCSFTKTSFLGPTNNNTTLFAAAGRNRHKIFSKIIKSYGEFHDPE